jgi:hypothetical protein
VRRSSQARVIQDNAPILVTWVVGVMLGFVVQIAEGLGSPSQGLALSAAAFPALFVALVPTRGRRLTAAVIIGTLGLLAVVDAVYHRAFDTFMPLRALTLTGQAWAVRAYTAELVQPSDILWPAVALIGIMVVLRISTGTDAPGRLRNTILPVVLCGLGALPAVAWTLYVAPFDADHVTGGFLHAHVVDVGRSLQEWQAGGDPTPEERARVRRYLDRPAVSGAAEDPWFGSASGSNVLMIQVEALNGWLLDAEVGSEPVVPVLRSLATRGFSFTGVFDQVHHGRSSDADYLVMASQYPLARGAVSMLAPTLDPVALPDLAREHGYATLSAHAHHKGFWNSGLRHARYGFQQSLFDVELGPGDSFGFGLTDEAFFQRVVPEIDALPQPYLAWLITMTMHAPYLALPPSFASLQLGSLEGTPLQLGSLEGTPLGGYFLQARHTDAALGHLLESLRVAGALENTTLVLFGDHSEQLGFTDAQLDEFAPTGGAAPGARRLLRERVPLIIVLPGQEEGRLVDAVGGIVDIGPTLLHLLGIDTPPIFMGRPLTTPSPGFAARASGQVVGSDRMWAGSQCFTYPEGVLVADEVCDDIRARAREELDVSWIVTQKRMGEEPGS